MNLLSLSSLHHYWQASVVQANLIVALNLLGALLLGIVVGYERAYQGRAAGMRTYGLVCMASAALMAVVGFPGLWYGGQPFSGFADPTRVIQGVVTGVGFLGAGVIMKDGLNIRGLTTAASIWAASAIGVLMGLGFYSAAMMMALLSTLSMTWVKRLELVLPTRSTLTLALRFRPQFVPREEVLSRVAFERGYEVVTDSLCITYEDDRPEWRFTAIALDRKTTTTPASLAEELARFEGVESFSIERNRT